MIALYHELANFLLCIAKSFERKTFVIKVSTPKTFEPRLTPTSLMNKVNNNTK